VREHSIFTRDGVTCYCEVPISIVGCRFGVVSGSANAGMAAYKLKIPGRDPNRKTCFRLRKQRCGPPVRGVAVLGGLCCVVTIENPGTSDPSAQKELLNEFQDTLDSGDGDQHWPEGKIVV